MIPQHYNCRCMVVDADSQVDEVDESDQDPLWDDLRAIIAADEAKDD